MPDLVKNISYIIGYRETNEERKKALLFVLRKLRNYFPSLEIIIVEQDEFSKLQLDSSLK